MKFLKVFLVSICFLILLVVSLVCNSEFFSVEVVLSIAMAAVLYELSERLSEKYSMILFFLLFIIRIIILIILDHFLRKKYVMLIDFFSLFTCVFLAAPAHSSSAPSISQSSSSSLTPSEPNTSKVQNNAVNVIMKCARCNTVFKPNDKYCSNCGAPYDTYSNVASEYKMNSDSATLENTTSNDTVPKVPILTSNFDKIFLLSEEALLTEFINRELVKAGIDQSSKLIPDSVLKRKKKLNNIFSILFFVFLSLIFFHFPIYTYIVGLLILIVFFVLSRRYYLVKHIKKQVKARPSEKISNIVLSIKNTLVVDDSKKTFEIGLLLALVLPLIIFSSPIIIYERVEGGYAVRFYAFRLTNFRTAVIPETYKGEKVVSLRGNTFSNMPFLEKVSLPDSITEIRGQAFKNCYNLRTVNIPDDLEYFGGGAFYNAKSIKSIVLPDTLTYLGGESFYGAESLEYIRLSENFSEIRGNTFENCESLESITIPDNVTRIGGHAFYGNSLLLNVYISENSKLEEIGSSAFRKCLRLYRITVPYDTYVSARAFKESPTLVERYSKTYWTTY